MNYERKREQEDAVRALADEHPRIGDGATLQIGSDSYAATVISVSPSGHRITVQYDRCRRTDGNGQSEAQSYEYERDVNGRTKEASRGKDGRYRIGGRRGSLVIIGERHSYRDPSF